jgi:DUF1680 family protein
MYTGAADVAAQTGDLGYLKAMRNVWEDVVFRNMYITGGIGSAGSNEGFSTDYDLPNEQAYCETCASVGMVFWNQRMNALTGNSEYIDVMERSLFNGALDGLSLSGDRFFYGNPLASRGQHARREWFGTACCPSNIARLVASLGDYVYTKSNEGIAINLFVGSNTNIKIGKTDISIKQETNYPWNGKVKLNIDPERKTTFKVYVRIPGWYTGKMVPGNLYTSTGMNIMQAAPRFTLNGKSIPAEIANGYAIIETEWKKGDFIEFEFDMPVKQINSMNELKQNNNRVAIQRGPLVYCVEGTDNNNAAWNIIVPPDTKFEEMKYDVSGEKVIALSATVPVLTVGNDKLSIRTENKKIIAIPYYTWANRGKTEMQVWLPMSIKDVKINY